MSKLQQIESDLNELKTVMNIKDKNNELNILLERIKNDISKNEFVNISKEKKRKTLTHQDMAEMEYPLDDTTRTGIIFNMNLLNKLISKLKNIDEKLVEIQNTLKNIDMDELSSSLNSFKNEIYHIKDELSISLYTAQDILKIEKLQNEWNMISEEEKVERLNKNLEEIEEVLYNTYKIISNISIPDENTIREEIDKTRNARIEEEIEAARPYQSLHMIKTKFNQGDIFTPKEFSSISNDLSLDAAKSIIKDCLKNGFVKETEENTYKLVKD